MSEAKSQVKQQVEKPHIILASASPRRLSLLKRAGIEAEVRVSNADETLPLELQNQPREAVKYLSQQKVQAVVTQLLLEIDASFQRSALEHRNAGVGFLVTREDENESYAKMPYLIIGADTMVVLNGEIYGKPRDAAHAKEILRTLSGNTHVVMTGVTMWYIYEAADAQEAAGAAASGSKSDAGDSEGAAVSAKDAADAEDAATNAPDAFTPSINIGVISFVDESEVAFNKLTDEQIDEYVATGECFDKAGAYAAQAGGDALIQQIDGNIDTVIGLPVTRMLKDYAAVLGID